MSATDGVRVEALSLSFWRRLSGVGVLEFSTGFATLAPFFLSLLIGVLSEERSVSLNTSGSMVLGRDEGAVPGLIMGTRGRTGRDTELGLGTEAFVGKGRVDLLRLLDEFLEVELFGAGVLEDSRRMEGNLCDLRRLYSR